MTAFSGFYIICISANSSFFKQGQHVVAILVVVGDIAGEFGVPNALHITIVI